MTEKLKPCPLCGSADVSFSEDIGWKDSYYVQCGNCQLDYGPDSDRESLLKHWNTRPSTPPAPDQAQPIDDEALVERIAWSIIDGSAGERAANHACEFCTANWSDALRSARAVLPIIRECLK